MYPELYKSFTEQQRYQFTPRVPYYYTTLGKLSMLPTQTAKYEFTLNYRASLATEWTPVLPRKPNAPLCVQPPVIYHTSIGMLPKYTGHVPGLIFRHGKSYGADTVDAKNWLRIATSGR